MTATVEWKPNEEDSWRAGNNYQGVLDPVNWIISSRNIERGFKGQRTENDQKELPGLLVALPLKSGGNTGDSRGAFKLPEGDGLGV
jgi:hypothetical protein